MTDDVHAISSEVSAAMSAPPQGWRGSVFSRRTSRRQALMTAAGLAAAAPLAGFLGRTTPGARAQDATPVAATPPPWMPPIQTEQVVLPQPDFRYPGVVGTTPQDSDPPDFPQIVTPPDGAPNVLLILVDDAGFGQFGTFGGPVPTPVADKLASEGLKYNRFHTTALCSPTRAALITGRNHHSASYGVVSEIATGYDGYTSIIPKSAATVAEILQLNGYSTVLVRQGPQRARLGAVPGRPLRPLADGDGLRLLLRLRRRRGRPVPSHALGEHDAGDAVSGHAGLQPQRRSGRQGDRVDPHRHHVRAAQAVFLLLLSRRHPRPAPGAGRVERPLQGPVRPGLGHAARGDVRPPEAARRHPPGRAAHPAPG